MQRMKAEIRRDDLTNKLSVARTPGALDSSPAELFGRRANQRTPALKVERRGLPFFAPAALMQARNLNSQK